MNVRLVALQGSDEFNVSIDGVQHQERIRPDHCWIVRTKWPRRSCRLRFQDSLNVTTTMQRGQRSDSCAA
jgi:hypothetical protein